MDRLDSKERTGLHATYAVNIGQGKVAGVLFATCYDIGGDASLDGVGTIINLGIVPCRWTSCSLSPLSVYYFILYRLA